jgi:hypothetical protein
MFLPTFPVQSRLGHSHTVGRRLLHNSLFQRQGTVSHDSVCPEVCLSSMSMYLIFSTTRNINITRCVPPSSLGWSTSWWCAVFRRSPTVSPITNTNHGRLVKTEAFFAINPGCPPYKNMSPLITNLFVLCLIFFVFILCFLSLLSTVPC